MRIFLVVLLFVAVPAFAVEPLASSTLIEQCSGNTGTDRRVCKAWVHGFIGGSFASRTAKYASPDEPETYSERARRTRISRGRTVYGRNIQAGYCLPAETTLDELVDKLDTHVEELAKIPEHANQLILGLLRKQYPC
ncbi:MAG: Rap1a/Tai family immunity protein [Gammaproteobacteria bacterium]|nr:Rap1a/Tai family immunity protein [Gammaproteobacteria bacterium]MDH3577009.1 Rap1a/Tai family immunity protein [Gammaproteobacteria bacterium]